MHVNEIALRDFRNYSNQTIKLSNQTNIIIGSNAQGKTNILEAIYCCSYGRSFRTSKDIELISEGKTACRIKLSFTKDRREQTIDIINRSDKKRQIRVNEVPIKSLSEIVGILNIVLFSPEDLKLIKGAPSERRKFLDREISHISRSYINNLILYNKVLNQRNKLLKQLAFKKTGLETLSSWDEQLVHYGTAIILKRMEYVDKLNSLAQKVHGELTENKELISVEYFISDFLQNTADYDKMKSVFKDGLIKCRDRDIKLGSTSIGPHKDDITITINDRDTRKYASQGQQRTAALSLKIAEIELIKAIVGESPVLLLDDVLSELDLKRQVRLLQAIKNIQTIITTTDLTSLDYELLAPFFIIEIENGVVLSCQEVKNVDKG